MNWRTEEDDMRNEDVMSKKYSIWGHKFEQLMTGGETLLMVYTL